MIQYDFDPRFWKPIASGTKRATLKKLRMKPRRHAKPDEPIELWSIADGRRFKIRNAACAGIDGVFMDLGRDIFRLGDITQNRKTWPDLDLGGRTGLAIATGFASWKEAADYYLEKHGAEPVTLCLVTWRDREYDGPIPSAPQLRDLRVLTRHERVVPAYGKISTTVGHGLVVLKWAEVCDRQTIYRTASQIGQVPIRITELGRWILERFEK